MPTFGWSWGGREYLKERKGSQQGGGHLKKLDGLTDLFGGAAYAWMATTNYPHNPSLHTANVFDPRLYSQSRAIQHAMELNGGWLTRAVLYCRYVSPCGVSRARRLHISSEASPGAQCERCGSSPLNFAWYSLDGDLSAGRAWEYDVHVDVADSNSRDMIH